MNYIYKLPIFKASGLTHSVLGGWELAGTIIDETGVPTIPAMSLNYDTIGLGGGYTNRPSASGKVKKLEASRMPLTHPYSVSQLRHGQAAPTRALEAQAGMRSPDQTV